MYFLCWEEQCLCSVCMRWKYIGERHHQSVIMTSALNQSQMDMQLSSSRAKQEAHWAALQRANESLREDLPAGLEPTPLGTERSVVSSMPPNEMHRVIWLTICIFLQASRACDGDARPDMEMSRRCVFSSTTRRRHILPSASSWWGNSNIWLKTAPSSCVPHGVCCLDQLRLFFSLGNQVSIVVSLSFTDTLPRGHFQKMHPNQSTWRKYATWM